MSPHQFFGPLQHFFLLADDHGLGDLLRCIIRLHGHNLCHRVRFGAQALKSLRLHLSPHRRCNIPPICGLERCLKILQGVRCSNLGFSFRDTRPMLHGRGPSPWIVAPRCAHQRLWRSFPSYGGNKGRRLGGRLIVALRIPPTPGTSLGGRLRTTQLSRGGTTPLGAGFPPALWAHCCYDDGARGEPGYGRDNKFTRTLPKRCSSRVPQSYPRRPRPRPNRPTWARASRTWKTCGQQRPKLGQFRPMLVHVGHMLAEIVRNRTGLPQVV